MTAWQVFAIALATVGIQAGLMGCVVLIARRAMRTKKPPVPKPCPIGGCRFPRGHLWPCWFGDHDPHFNERN